MEELDWNQLDNNTIRALKFACEQLRLHPHGGKKKDYVYALNKYQRHQSEKQTRGYSNITSTYVPPSTINNTYISIPSNPQNDYISPALLNDSYETPSARNNQYRNQGFRSELSNKPNEFQNQNEFSHHRKTTPKSSRQNEFYSSGKEKIVSHPTVYNPPRSAQPSHRFRDYPQEKKTYNDYASYSSQSEYTTSESERLSPVLPSKTTRHRSSKKTNQPSTCKKILSILMSIILVILILYVIILLL